MTTRTTTGAGRLTRRCLVLLALALAACGQDKTGGDAATPTQARAVIDGLDANVVTLASLLDTDAIRKKDLIRDDGFEPTINAEITSERFADLGLKPGDTVRLSPRRVRAFVPGEPVPR